MSATGSGRWLALAAIVAVVYTAIGLWFPNPAEPREQQIAWRLGAWIVSGVVFAAQIAYEQLRWRSPVRATALHAALAAALGAFGLAAAATLRALVGGSGRLMLHAISLLAWPFVTALPAFLVALAAAAVLARVAGPRPGSGSAPPSGRAPGA